MHYCTKLSCSLSGQSSDQLLLTTPTKQLRDNAETPSQMGGIIWDQIFPSSRSIFLLSIYVLSSYLKDGVEWSFNKFFWGQMSPLYDGIAKKKVGPKRWWDLNFVGCSIIWRLLWSTKFFWRTIMFHFGVWGPNVNEQKCWKTIWGLLIIWS